MRCSYPFSGTLTPHLRLRVIHLGLSPVFSQTRARFRVLSGHWSCLSIHFFSFPSSSGRFRNKCFSFLKSISCLLQTLHLGFWSCSGSRIVLHFSHWSPRALSYPQTGQVPII